MDDITYTPLQLPTTNPFVLTDVANNAEPALLQAELYTPATLSPPFPAVVVCEGLGGVKTQRERRYGRFLAQNGFVGLVIDSFATRGFANAPHPIRAINVTETMMLADAFAGLAWLSEQPEVDAKRIYITGFSYGGMITVLTAYEQLRKTFIKTDDKFAAHVSYYGPTVPRLEDYRTTGAPVVILNGELDQNFDPKRLENIAQDLRNGGSAVENIVFADTYHQWDSDDLVRRFDRFNIQRLGTRITPDAAILDERTGRVVRGFSSRLALIAGSVSLSGFHLMRNADVMRKTDEIMLRTFSVRADDEVPPDTDVTALPSEAAAALPPAEAPQNVRLADAGKT